MPDTISTGNAPRLLSTAMLETFGINYARWQPVHPLIFDVKQSDQAYEEALQLVGMGMAAKKDEGDDIRLGSLKQGYPSIFYHQTWSKRIRITMEAFDDVKHISYADWGGKELAKALLQAKEYNASLILNNPTSTSTPYKLGDGKALAATDHPTGSGGTFNNKPTIDADLSELALEQACNDIWLWPGSDGLPIMASPQKLIVHPSNVFNAQRILKSDLQNDTANNSINALKSMGLINDIIKWVYLTDLDQWTIVTDQDGACLYQRQSPEMHQYNDDNNMDYVYAMYERYVFGVFDPRRFYISVGA